VQAAGIGESAHPDQSNLSPNVRGPRRAPLQTA